MAHPTSLWVGCIQWAQPTPPPIQPGCRLIRGDPTAVATTITHTHPGLEAGLGLDGLCLPLREQLAEDLHEDHFVGTRSPKSHSRLWVAPEEERCFVREQMGDVVGTTHLVLQVELIRFGRQTAFGFRTLWSERQLACKTSDRHQDPCGDIMRTFIFYFG